MAVLLAAFLVVGCGSPFWESGLQEDAAVANNTSERVWVVVEDPDDGFPRYVADVDPHDTDPADWCDVQGARISVYGRDPGGQSDVAPPPLPIDQALAVRQLDEDERVCERGEDNPVLTWDGEQITFVE